MVKVIKKQVIRMQDKNLKGCKKVITKIQDFKK